jgi:hypothetical protein
LGPRLMTKGGCWRTIRAKKVKSMMMISTHDGKTSRIIRWFIIFHA